MVALDTRAVHVSAILALATCPTRPGVEELEPTARRQRILRPSASCCWPNRRAPLLLVVENLQWADSETHACIEEVAAGLATRGSSCSSARARASPRLGDERRHTEIRLDPLPRPAPPPGRLDPRTGADLALLKRRLITHTAGNPFFPRRPCRRSSRRARFRRARPLPAREARGGIQIPDRVQAVLARASTACPSRTNRSSRRARHRIDVPVPASRCGEPRPKRCSAAGHSRPPTSCGRARSYRTSPIPSSTRSPRRRVLHAPEGAAPRAARAHRRRSGDELSAERRGEHVERLAYHALRRTRGRRPSAYLRDAGERAVARSANLERRLLR